MTQLTVTALNKYIHAKFSKDPYLENITVVGELTDLNATRKTNYRALYFSIKDEESQIRAVWFRPRAEQVPLMENGKKVVIKGDVTVYQKQGAYQINVKSVEFLGMGELYQIFLKNKAMLEAEGVFNRPRKQLPRFPKKIAVITARTGAVIHDIKKTIEQRYPLTKIVLFTSMVQGEHAAKSMIQQINAINQRQDEFDAVIIGRGGGSFEDLFCYNDPDLIRIASKMALPIVVAVGHESDHPLIEEIGDYVASTPTQAAMALTPDRMELIQWLKEANGRMYQTVAGRYRQAFNRLVQIKSSRPFENPETIYRQKEQTLDNMTYQLTQQVQTNYQQQQERLLRAMQGLNINQFNEQLKQKQQQVQHMTVQLDTLSQHTLTKKQHSLETLTKQLQLLNPLDILDRGYSYVTDDKQQMIHSVKQFKEQDRLIIHLSDGEIEVEVKSIKENAKYE